MGLENIQKIVGLFNTLDIIFNNNHMLSFNVD